MTLHARKALADCEVAHELLKKEKRSSRTWRVHWVACLTLLRAVGHVLDKADGEFDAKQQRAISAKWGEWKANRATHNVFWNFFDMERNNLLKEYKFGVEPEANYLLSERGELIVTEQGDAIVTEDDFFRLSHIGFEDLEGRDVILAAINWWRLQLDAIEALSS